MDPQAILGQLFGGGAALAGLILVFLGGILTSYDSYDPTAQKAVRTKYLVRAWLAFAGFASALVSAGTALAGMFLGPTGWLCAGVSTLVLSGILLVVMAVLSIKEIR